MTWEQQLAAAEVAGHTLEIDTSAPQAVTMASCTSCQSSLLMTSSGFTFGSAGEMSCADALEVLAAAGAFLEGVLA